MTRLRYHRPAPPPPPAAPPPPDTFGFVVRVAAIGAMVVGIIVAARWIERQTRPAAGWVCWDVARVTSEDTQRDRRCEPEEGWHIERWPDGTMVAVPDHAVVVRRYPVRD
jgi:hypothetical protein